MPHESHTAPHDNTERSAVQHSTHTGRDATAPEAGVICLVRQIPGPGGGFSPVSLIIGLYGGS